MMPNNWCVITILIEVIIMAIIKRFFALIYDIVNLRLRKYKMLTI